METFQESTKFLLTLSEKASEIMLRYYSSGGMKADIKSDMTPVTKADIEINTMVITEVKKHYPDYEVLGEEESTDVKGATKLFVVDPLDGTHMFSIGSPLFGFMAAIVIDGESVAGVLMNPLAKRTLLAEKGKGTYLVEENKRVHVSTKNTFDRALVNAGWNDDNLPRLLHARGARTPEMYSVCEKASLIAVGGLEGETFDGTTVHDVAAVKIVVEEAGGRVTDLQGNEQRYDREIGGAILSNGLLHDELVAMVREAGIKPKYKNL
jgi:histidinol-phosphatase